MARLTVLAVLMLGLLAGCGQVIVFGHVMGEHRSGEPKPEATTTPAETTSASAAEATQSAGTAAQSTASAAQSAGSAAHSGGAAAAQSAGTAGSQAPPSHAAPLAAHAVKAVSIVVTPEVTAKVSGDASRFTSDALLDAIKTELKSRKLLDEQSPNASGTAEVVVDDLATRPTTNAILFGYKMLAGTLEGDIRVTGASDTDSTGSRIVAQSKLTVAASGDDKNPLGPLYRRFAVLAADRLAGVTSKPEEPTGVPRF